jgi:hypothetical protein
MRGIAKLLFGEDAGKVLDLFSGGSDGDGFGLAEQARRSGEWCGTTPGRDSAARAAARSAAARSAAARSAGGTRRAQRQITIRW